MFPKQLSKLKTFLLSRDQKQRPVERGRQVLLMGPNRGSDSPPSYSFSKHQPDNWEPNMSGNLTLNLSPMALASPTLAPEIVDSRSWNRENLAELSWSASPAPSSVGPGLFDTGIHEVHRTLLLQTTYRSTSSSSSFYSASSSSSGRVLDSDQKSAFGDVTPSTVTSMFNAYEREGITSDLYRVAGELEMYVPVTRVMARILQARSYLFRGRELDTARLAASLEQSCHEVDTFLSILADSVTSSTCNLAEMGRADKFGKQYEIRSQLLGHSEDEVIDDPENREHGRSGGSLRKIISRKKQSLQGKAANLIVRIPIRGPRWLLDRVLKWTVVSRSNGKHQLQGVGMKSNLREEID